MEQKKPEEQRVLETGPLSPFESIALCFSGGGYRAAAYSLGVLSLLNEVPFGPAGAPPLLRKVSYISSASGGTITAGLYALRSTEKDFAFDGFYSDFIALLQGDELLKKALNILTTPEVWKAHPHKAQNLINSFAIAYSEKDFFDGKTFGDLLPKSYSNYHHLEEVCFNATDLFKGHTFRQQFCFPKNKSNRLVFGNHYLQVDKTLALKIKLADALAASSCFPAGFEPMAFPNDFFPCEGDRKACIDGIVDILCNTNVIATDTEIEAVKTNGFGLMDGGITDNLGLDSLMMADKRSNRTVTENDEKKHYRRFDLIMVNDVSSHYMDAYKVPDAPSASFTKKLNLNNTFLVVMGVFILSTVGLVTQLLIGSPLAKWFILFPSALAFGASFTILVIWRVVRSYIFSPSEAGMNLHGSFSAEIINRLYDYFAKTRLHVLLLLGTARIKSVISLNTDLFLKSNRRMVLNQFYGKKNWRSRGKGNHIYDLSLTNMRRIFEDLNTLPPELRTVMRPSDKMMDVAEKAFKMATTLWFDKVRHKEEVCAKIVATGQFTTCYNLIFYIINLRKSESWKNFTAEEHERVNQIEAHLMQLWERFKQDPEYLCTTIQSRHAADTLVKNSTSGTPEDVTQ